MCRSNTYVFTQYYDTNCSFSRNFVLFRAFFLSQVHVHGVLKYQCSLLLLFMVTFATFLSKNPKKIPAALQHRFLSSIPSFLSTFVSSLFVITTTICHHCYLPLTYRQMLPLLIVSSLRLFACYHC